MGILNYRLAKVSCDFDNSGSKEGSALMHDGSEGTVIDTDGPADRHTQNPSLSSTFWLLFKEFCPDSVSLDQIKYSFWIGSVANCLQRILGDTLEQKINVQRCSLLQLRGEQQSVWFPFLLFPILSLSFSCRHRAGANHTLHRSAWHSDRSTQTFHHTVSNGLHSRISSEKVVDICAHHQPIRFTHDCNLEKTYSPFDSGRISNSGRQCVVVSDLNLFNGYRILKTNSSNG